MHPADLDGALQLSALLTAQPARGGTALPFAVEEAGLAPGEVYVIERWHLIERIGLRHPPLEDYLFSTRIDPALLDRAEMVLTIYPHHADALRALGWEVREARGAPEGFGPEDFWHAIRTRDIEGLRAVHGEPIFIATRPG